jgi:signal transduction histidine kinase
MIKDHTQTSMEAMSDIVWMITSKNDRFENIIVRMRTLAAEIFDATNCELQVNFDESLNDLKLGMEKRKNFYLLYKEAINNIAKYADCRNVHIEMKMNHAAVHLTIEDDGKGFDNMKKRAEVLNGSLQILSTLGEGTRLSLQFKI